MACRGRNIDARERASIGCLAHTPGMGRLNSQKTQFAVFSLHNIFWWTEPLHVVCYYLSWHFLSFFVFRKCSHVLESEIHFSTDLLVAFLWTWKTGMHLQWLPERVKLRGLILFMFPSTRRIDDLKRLHWRVSLPRSGPQCALGHKTIFCIHGALFLTLCPVSLPVRGCTNITVSSII